VYNKIYIIKTYINQKSEYFVDNISDEIIERTATSKAYAKNLIKIWITKGWIIKNKDNKYATR
jgi:DNA-binding MarR family transcriptional regulator